MLIKFILTKEIENSIKKKRCRFLNYHLHSAVSITGKIFKKTIIFLDLNISLRKETLGCKTSYEFYCDTKILERITSS